VNIRRYYMPNSIVFITQVVDGRQPVFQHKPHLDLLLATIRQAKERYPFRMLGYVFLPDHFHLLIQPREPVTHSQVMHSIKPNYTKAYKQEIGITGSMKSWQKRCWDHLIRDEQDFERRLDYIHYNPVKHGYVQRPEDWSSSSYSTWQGMGVYPDGRGWKPMATLPEFDDVDGYNFR
jgi:putative transposase